MGLCGNCAQNTWEVKANAIIISRTTLLEKARLFVGGGLNLRNVSCCEGRGWLHGKLPVMD